MAVVLRFRRLGANKTPHYRLVACDSRKAREGAYIENLGCYDPRKAKDNYTFRKDRVIEWLNKGAQPSETASVLLKKAGIIAEWKAIRKAAAGPKKEKKEKKEKKAKAAK